MTDSALFTEARFVEEQTVAAYETLAKSLGIWCISSGLTVSNSCEMVPHEEPIIEPNPVASQLAVSSHPQDRIRKHAKSRPRHNKVWRFGACTTASFTADTPSPD